jgi:hypothetical protein
MVVLVSDVHVVQERRPRLISDLHAKRKVLHLIPFFGNFESQQLQIVFPLELFDPDIDLLVEQDFDVLACLDPRKGRVLLNIIVLPAVHVGRVNPLLDVLRKVV